MSQYESRQQVVEARNLRKTFGDLVAVDDLTFNVAPGEVVGLLGPNGAGKTTTIKMLTTLLSPTAGTARVASFDVATESDGVRASIGLAGQAAAVDEKLTARENLDLFARLYGLGPTERRARVDHLIDRFRLNEFADQLVGTLSGGQRRRVDLIAALIANPPAVFLDEPTTGLDPRSRAEIWEEVRLLADEGVAVVLTTQYLDEADKLADRIILIDDGNVVAEGTQDELKNRLNRDVLEVRASTAADAGKIMSVVEGREARLSDDRTVHIRADGVADSLAILDAIRGSGAAMEDFSVSKPSLDDVFLAFTAVPEGGLNGNS